MKRFWSFALLLSSFALLIPQLAFAAAPDVPGRGYDPTTEPCGFVMGKSVTRTAPAYSVGFVNADVVSNSDQACVDATGYFYENGTGRNSWLMHSKWGYMDFVWSANPSENVRIDPLTGKWYGRAYLNQLTAKLRPVPMQDDKLQFDWTCHGETWCDPALLDTYRVHTDLSTGAISGVAWNVHTGYVDFGALSMELPPLEIQAFVDVVANEGGLTPSAANLNNAPQADGYQYWRTAVRFYNVGAQRFLTPAEVSNVDIALTTEGTINIDQVNNKGDATVDESKNPAVTGCASLAGVDSCLMTEADLSQSWNRFVYSIAPTSNMIGVADESGEHVKFPADRNGGISFYKDDPWGHKLRCALTSCRGSKEDHFYERTTSRNEVKITGVSVSNFQLAPAFLNGRNYTLKWADQAVLNGTSFDYTPPVSEQELKFRPNYITKRFDVSLGGDTGFVIPDDVEVADTSFTLNLVADKLALSAESIAAGRSEIVVLGSHQNGVYTVNTLLDQDNVGGRTTQGYQDKHFVIRSSVSEGGTLFASERDDTEAWVTSRWGAPVLPEDTLEPRWPERWFEEPGSCWEERVIKRRDATLEHGFSCPDDDPSDDADCTLHMPVTCDSPACDGPQAPGPHCTGQEMVTVEGDYAYRFGKPYSGISAAAQHFEETYNLGYQVPLTIERSVPQNNPEDATVEQYVCQKIDDAMAARHGVNQTTNPDICYYTAYMSILNNKTEPYPLKVTGTVDRQRTGSDSNLAVLGSSDLPKLRNELYAKVARYALGQSAAGGDLSLDQVAGGGVKELLDGRLLLAQGDVTIDGSDGFSDTTLAVLNGDVFIHGDVKGGRLQILVFGGNIYVDPSVKELNVNMFTDGSVFSDSGHYDENGVPVWGLGDRTETLVNQLLITGSVLSCNSIDGAKNLEDGQYDLGCGEKTSDYATALEHDLASLREFRLCYILDEFGNPTDDITSCGDTPAQALAGFPIDEPDNADWDFSTHVKHESPSSRQLDFGIF